MTGISGKQGKELLLAILEELKNTDPKIIPFDSDEVQTLEYGVAEGVLDIFGSGSPEYSEFEGFRIAAGNISRGDSRAEKQSKYELGLPRAIQRLEELINLIEQSDKKVHESTPDDPVKTKPGEKTATATPSPPKAIPRPKAKDKDPDPVPKEEPKVPPKAAPRAETKPDTKTAPRPASEPSPPARKASPAASADQPGRILLFKEGGGDISGAVISLLEKVGIDLALMDEDSTSEMESITELKNIAFTIMTVSSESRVGLSGLTSVIGKPSPRHESAFKLGLLVGSLGPGKVVILHGGERPQDIPEDLFGVRYLPYKREGGWQIGLLKLLKANGFYIDANLLFD